MHVSQNGTISFDPWPFGCYPGLKSKWLLEWPNTRQIAGLAPGSPRLCRGTNRTPPLGLNMSGRRKLGGRSEPLAWVRKRHTCPCPAEIERAARGALMKTTPQTLKLDSFFAERQEEPSGKTTTSCTTPQTKIGVDTPQGHTKLPRLVSLCSSSPR